MTEEDGVLRPCFSPEHSPPSHMVYKPGQTYEHTCPLCGAVTLVQAQEIRW